MIRAFPESSAPNPRRGICARAAALGFALVLVAAGSAPAPAQMQRNTNNTVPQRYPGQGQIATDPFDEPVYTVDPMREQAEAKRLRAMNEQRQKSMVADADRLVKMTADLNAQVNSEQRSQLTPDEERQLAEIQKLAHNIRQKMSASVKQTPATTPNSMTPFGMR